MSSTGGERQSGVYQTYVVGRKTYWRTVSVVMACHAYNAASPSYDGHWFDATWQPKWWGGKVLTLRECYAVRESGDL